MHEIASDLISNIESYQQLLTTLALGISAGAFALVTQVIFQSATGSHAVRLQWPSIILVGIIIEFISICFGIFTKSALVASVPALHNINWTEDSATKALSEHGLSHISLFAELQILFFILGVVVFISLLIVNWKILR